MRPFRTSIPVLLFILPLLFPSCWLSDKNKDQGISSDVINNPQSASGNEEGEQPEISFEEELHDFGTISQGEKVEHAFVFTNTGDAPLVIASVEPSCGCTVTDDRFDDPIPPGEKDTLVVNYDSKGHNGHQNRTVSIVANTSPKTTTIHLRGTVRGPG